FIQAEDGIRVRNVTGVQTCALPILSTSVRTFGAKQIPRPDEYSTRTGEGHFVLEQGRRKFATRGGYAVIVIAHYGVQFQQMHPGSIFVLTGTTADKFYQPVKSIFDMTT